MAKKKKLKLKRYHVEVRVPQGYTIPVRARSKTEAKRIAKKKLKPSFWVSRDRRIEVM